MKTKIKEILVPIFIFLIVDSVGKDPSSRERSSLAARRRYWRVQLVQADVLGDAQEGNELHWSDAHALKWTYAKYGTAGLIQRPATL